AFVACFQAGSFDGMTDMYEYDRASFVEIDGGIYRPSTRYVFTQRTVSARLIVRAARAVASYWHLTTEERAEILAAAAALEASTEPRAECDFWMVANRIR